MSTDFMSPSYFSLSRWGHGPFQRVSPLVRDLLISRKILSFTRPLGSNSLNKRDSMSQFFISVQTPFK